MHTVPRRAHNPGAARAIAWAARFEPSMPAANAATVADSVDERARRRLVRLVFVIYLLAIFEGALRKYALPSLGQYIFFIRDPFLVWAYVVATRWKMWPRRSAMFRAALALAVAGTGLLILQSAFGAPSDLRLLLGAYGWRAYFLYAPLAFLIGEQFHADDLARLARTTLWLSVPIAVLVAAQFFSPPGSVVNIGTAEDRALQFHDLTVDTDHIRAAGPFSSNVGQQQFTTTALAMLLALMMTPAAQRRVGTPTLLVSAGALLTCVALGGSRGTTLQCVMILLFSLPVALLSREPWVRARAALLPAALAIGAVVLYPVIFPEGFAVFMQRWQTAAADESGFEGGVLGRALFGFVDFVRLVDIVPPLGYGLGFGGNASTVLQATVDGVQPGLLAETDFARHMVDLGVASGIVYIAFRVAFVAWMLRLVVRATRRTASPLPMMLFAYAGYVILLGQITGNGSVNVYGWLFAGLCLAAVRSASARVVAPASSLARQPLAPRARTISRMPGANRNARQVARRASTGSPRAPAS